jgi:hypothetical protein
MLGLITNQLLYPLSYATTIKQNMELAIGLEPMTC